MNITVYEWGDCKKSNNAPFFFYENEKQLRKHSDKEYDSD